jgi:(2Fe-2S) ferredoxin
MYAKVGKDDVAAIYDEHLEQGQPVERLLMTPEFWG